jgi:hypothetical protein
VGHAVPVVGTRCGASPDGSLKCGRGLDAGDRPPNAQARSRHRSRGVTPAPVLRATGGLHHEQGTKQPRADSGSARVAHASACYTGPIAIDDLSIGRHDPDRSFMRRRGLRRGSLGKEYPVKAGLCVLRDLSAPRSVANITEPRGLQIRLVPDPLMTKARRAEP